ncbi:unnamed protein product [Camellia sinensis]
MDGFHGSVDFMVKETEKLHARVGRYKSPDEHPFFLDDLPDPMLPPLQYPQVLHPIADAININNKIWDMYFRDLLTRLVREGDDGNCGSAAVCDTICLQALSKRIHYGKFVAEAKFRASPDAYEAAIRAQVYILFFRCTGCIHSFSITFSKPCVLKQVMINLILLNCGACDFAGQDSTDGFADVSHCGRGDKE